MITTRQDVPGFCAALRRSMLKTCKGCFVASMYIMRESQLHSVVESEQGESFMKFLQKCCQCFGSWMEHTNNTYLFMVPANKLSVSRKSCTRKQNVIAKACHLPLKRFICGCVHQGWWTSVIVRHRTKMYVETQPTKWLMIRNTLVKFQLNHHFAKPWEQQTIYHYCHQWHCTPCSRSKDKYACQNCGTGLRPLPFPKFCFFLCTHHLQSFIVLSHVLL